LDVLERDPAVLEVDFPTILDLQGRCTLDLEKHVGQLSSAFIGVGVLDECSRTSDHQCVRGARANIQLRLIHHTLKAIDTGLAHGEEEIPMRNRVQSGMSLLGLTLELFELLGGNSQGFVFTSVEVEAQHFNEDRVGLVHSNGEKDSVFLSIETEWFTFGIENSRPRRVSKLARAIATWGELMTDPSGKICTICFPRIKDALWMMSPGFTLRSEMDSSRS
jgi:hypothetical protein